jgi:hypothetical protein
VPGSGSGRLVPGSGSGRLVPGSGSGHLVPGSSSGRLVPGSSSGYHKARHNDLHVLPDRMPSASSGSGR